MSLYTYRISSTFARTCFGTYAFSARPDGKLYLHAIIDSSLIDRWTVTVDNEYRTALYLALRLGQVYSQRKTMFDYTVHSNNVKILSFLGPIMLILPRYYYHLPSEVSLTALLCFSQRIESIIVTVYAEEMFRVVKLCTEKT